MLPRQSLRREAAPICAYETMIAAHAISHKSGVSTTVVRTIGVVPTTEVLAATPRKFSAAPHRPHSMAEAPDRIPFHTANAVTASMTRATCSPVSPGQIGKRTTVLANSALRTQGTGVRPNLRPAGLESSGT
jgi:hypothetical protein